MSPVFEFRAASSEDGSFVVEMARHVCTLDGRPLPDSNDPQVRACLPASDAATFVALDRDGRRLGAAWWVLRDVPLLCDPEGSPLPEIAIAVVESERGKGIGGALLDELAEAARGTFSALTLNVHLLNPAVRLYIRKGFTVAGAGRGPYGVAMTLRLDK